MASFWAFHEVAVKMLWGLVVTGRLDWVGGSAIRLAPFAWLQAGTPVLSGECPYGVSASVPSM